ncbi:MAG: fasciclin domain-containing protein, partial [Prevotella sp.]
MKIKKQLWLILGGLLIGICLMSCTDDISNDDHYKRPSWLKENAYKVLHKEGNYSIFLKGIDLSGYKPIVDGNSVLTVMAPNDDAFKVFLTQKGYGSIEEINDKDPVYLKKLIGYHLIYYSYDWNKLVNFRPSAGDGATTEEKNLHAGYYYKHRTHSSDPVEQIRVKFTPNASSDTLIHIYHYEQYVPVFSDQLFKTKGIDPVYNYQYFYPHSKWNGINDAAGSFNVSNARVSDSGNI